MTIAIKTFMTLLMLLSLGSADVQDLTKDGIAHFEAGELEEAQDDLTEAVAVDEKDHLAQAYLGRVALAREQFDEAIAHLETAVGLDPANSPYFTWLGKAYLAKMQTVSFMERGRYTVKVLGNLETAVELDPENLEARTTLAYYYAKAPAIGGGDPAKARAQVEAIKAIDPEAGEAIEAELF
jgi:tetratricopeptide (TPR) repeat protein